MHERRLPGMTIAVFAVAAAIAAGFAAPAATAEEDPDVKDGVHG